MAPWGRGEDDDVHDFDDYDPTPYGGGYDIALTYGRPVVPCEDTCYPVASSSTSIGDGVTDYERPHYSSSSQSKPTAYDATGGEVAGSGRYGYGSSSRPEPQAAYGFQPNKEEVDQEGGDGGGQYGYGGGRRPQSKPEYGFETGMNRPGYGGGGTDYVYSGGKDPSTDYGYGAEYDARPKREQDSSYGHGHGYEQDHPKLKPYSEEQPGYGYGGTKYETGGGENAYGGGSDYKKTDAYGYGGGEYKRAEEYDARPKPKREQESSYGHGYEQDHPKLKPYSEEQPGYGYGGSKYETSGGENPYGGGSDYKKTDAYGYGGGEYKRTEEYGYGEKPSYGRPNYERPDVDEEKTGRSKMPSYNEPDQGGGYRQPKYGDDSDDEEKGDDSDDEEKKRRHNKNHHRHGRYADDE